MEQANAARNTDRGGTERVVLTLCKHRGILDRFIWDLLSALGRFLFTCYLQSHWRQMLWRIDSMCLFNKFVAELPTQCRGYYPFNNPASGVSRPCPLMITSEAVISVTHLLNVTRQTQLASCPAFDPWRPRVTRPQRNRCIHCGKYSRVKACTHIGVPRGGCSNPPPPKFRNFDKVEPDCKLSGKCLVSLFQRPN